jgi:hypothetical protein
MSKFFALPRVKEEDAVISPPVALPAPGPMHSLPPPTDFVPARAEADCRFVWKMVGEDVLVLGNEPTAVRHFAVNEDLAPGQADVAEKYSFLLRRVDAETLLRSAKVERWSAAARRNVRAIAKRATDHVCPATSSCPGPHLCVFTDVDATACKQFAQLGFCSRCPFPHVEIAGDTREPYLHRAPSTLTELMLPPPKDETLLDIPPFFLSVAFLCALRSLPEEQLVEEVEVLLRRVRRVEQSRSLALEASREKRERRIAVDTQHEARNVGARATALNMNVALDYSRDLTDEDFASMQRREDLVSSKFHRAERK